MKVEPIVTVLLTGFLGSGKTTLLSRLLASGRWLDTAVVVNELGEVGLDHRLLWQSAGQVMLLDGGCLCCGGGENLVETLESLFWSRLHRKLPYFRRVVIETTGLADPRSIAAMLRMHPLIAERYRLALVIATVDAAHGAAALERHPESLAQARCADLIAITKTDLCDGARAQTLQDDLARLNVSARVAVADDVTPDLVDALAAAPAATAHPDDTTPRPFAPRGELSGRTVFHGRVVTCTVRFERPWSRAALQAALEAIATRFGARILRLKGTVAIDGESAPVVVQMVAGQLSPLVTCEPSPDTPHGFIVAIMQDDLQPTLRALLSAFQDARR